MKLNKVFLIILILSAMLVSSGICQAGSYWKTGHVTKAPWHGRYWHVEINAVQYSLMPEVSMLVPSVRKSYRQDRDHFLPSPFLNTGTRLTVKVEGRRIYEIIVSK